MQLLPGRLFAFLLWRALAGVFSGNTAAPRRVSAQPYAVVAVIKNPAVLDVASSNAQAATHGLTSLITQLVVIPAPMITGYLIAAWYQVCLRLVGNFSVDRGPGARPFAVISRHAKLVMGNSAWGKCFIPRVALPD